MKRFILVLALSAMMSMPMFAERVTPETALKVATTFLNNNDAKSDALTDLSKAAGFENLYIFTTESSFVVMSADDCVKPVLGYSLTNKFAVEDMPENLRWWLQGYSDGIQDAIDYQTKATAETSKLWKDLSAGNSKTAKATSVVEALIQTKWDQNSRYNSACPLASGGPGGHVYAGCVATAMAQLIYFWNQGNTHPTIGIGSHTYIHNTYGVQSVNFAETTYDWNNMPNKLSSTSTAAQINAVATLMYHCGVAVDMDYGPGGSGAFSSDIPSALINYFNFSKSAEYKKRYESTEGWIADLKQELDQSRPMEYSGTSDAGGGHSFICDGYDSDDKFHFNWGWNGSSNGFFSISIDDNINYKKNQAAVFGIKPAICSADAPADFSANWVSGTRNVDLSWDIVSNATGYKLFRNGDLIATLSSGNVTSFTDETIPYGANIYHLRSLDSNGEMSLPSTYETVILDFPAPTNFQASLSASGTVNLSWNPSANYYNVYCNDVLIAAQVSGISYEDTQPIPGSIYYYVKAVDTFGDESVASNSVTVSVPYKTPAVNDLRASTSGQNVSLSWSAPTWCYPQNESAILSYYSSQNVHLLWDPIYYGQRFPAEDLTSYANKSLYKVSTQIQFVGTYTVYVYTNTIDGLPDPESLAGTRTLKCTQGGWREIPLDTPVPITGDTDLWIVFEQTDTQSVYPVPSFDLSSYNENACFAGYDSPTMLLNPEDNVSWFIKAYLTDGVYTYNLYEGSTKLNGNTPISDTNYTIESDSKANAIHNYTVKTNYYGGESEVSNKASLALGSNTLSSLDLEGSDNMTLGRSSTLNVGTLSNTNPANLVLEDGAQLFHNSANVKATVKKNITSYNNGGGWNFIASPVGVIATNQVTGLLTSTSARLYAYDEPSHYWAYHTGTQAPFTSMASNRGYLYANADDVTLEFSGTLVPSESVTINNLSHRATELNGFNLVGNPFACNATINRDCYVIEDGQVVLASSNKVFAPCEGAFVKATESNASVTFTKAASAKGSISKDCLDLVITQDNSTLDRVRLRLGEGIGMEKFSLDDEHSQISLWQNGEDLAVAYANGANELPLSFKAEKGGTYSLFVEANSLDLDYLHLIDNLTGNDVDLLALRQAQGPASYTFEAKTTDYASRFRLLFSLEEDGPSTGTGTAGAFAYYADGEIHLAETCQGASLQVVDMTGRIVFEGDAMNRVSTSRMTPGVYVLRLINGETVKTQKIVIE